MCHAAHEHMTQQNVLRLGAPWNKWTFQAFDDCQSYIIMILPMGELTKHKKLNIRR